MRRLATWMACFWAALISVILYASVAHPIPNPQTLLAEGVARPSSSGTTAVHSSAAIATFHVKIGADPADLYLPRRSNAATQTTTLPIALLLPGALVNRTHYSQFASSVARQGFAVVVPTHIRSFPGVGLSGEFSEASQIPAALTFLEKENLDPNSFLYQKLDVANMALLGHSHGGFVGLQAIANVCTAPFCSPPFSRPDAVKAGIFYGVNSQNPSTGKFIATPNNKIPVALVQGSLDGVATPDEARATFELIETPPKALITVEGTNHYGITNTNNPPGAVPDRSVPTLEQSQGVETIAEYTATFLRAHLYQDLDAFKRIYGSEQPTQAVTITSVSE